MTLQPGLYRSRTYTDVRLTVSVLSGGRLCLWLHDLTTGKKLFMRVYAPSEVAQAQDDFDRLVDQYRLRKVS